MGSRIVDAYHNIVAFLKCRHYTPSTPLKWFVFLFLTILRIYKVKNIHILQIQLNLLSIHLLMEANITLKSLVISKF